MIAIRILDFVALALGALVVLWARFRTDLEEDEKTGREFLFFSLLWAYIPAGIAGIIALHVFSQELPTKFVQRTAAVASFIAFFLENSPKTKLRRSLAGITWVLTLILISYRTIIPIFQTWGIFTGTAFLMDLVWLVPAALFLGSCTIERLKIQGKEGACILIGALAYIFAVLVRSFDGVSFPHQSLSNWLDYGTVITVFLFVIATFINFSNKRQQARWEFFTTLLFFTPFVLFMAGIVVRLIVL